MIFYLASQRLFDIFEIGFFGKPQRTQRGRKIKITTLCALCGLIFITITGSSRRN